MIDLNYKPKKQEEPKEEINFFHVIGTLAFVALVWLCFTEAFINGIY